MARCFKLAFHVYYMERKSGINIVCFSLRNLDGPGRFGYS